jgi:hypothetical protein
MGYLRPFARCRRLPPIDSQQQPSIAAAEACRGRDYAGRSAAGSPVMNPVSLEGNDMGDGSFHLAARADGPTVTATWTKDTPNNSCYDFAVSRGLIV